MYNISFRKHYEVHTIVNVLRGLGSQHVTLISTSVAMLIRYFTIVFLVVKIRSLPKDSNAVPPSLSQTLNNDRKVCNASNTKKQPSSCFSYTTNCGTYDATQPFYLNLVRCCLIILEIIQRDKQDLIRPVTNDSFEEESIIVMQSSCY